MADYHAKTEGIVVDTVEVGRLPIAAESLRVGRHRRVTGRLRVSVTTAEAPEVVETTRRSRHVEVERVRIDREVDAAPPIRQDGDMLIVPVLEERVVLVRKLFLTEEIRFRMQVVEEAVTLSAPQLRQTVDVTRLDLPDEPWGSPIFNPTLHTPNAYPQTAYPRGETPMKRTITAMFDTRAEADRAAESLRAMNIGASAIRVYASETTTTTTTTDTTQDRGILSAIANLFVPDDDRAAYSEGLRRGATLVTAEVDVGQVDTAMDALEAAGAVDLDNREAGWRQEGWTGGTMATGATAVGLSSSDHDNTGVSAMTTGTMATGTMATGTMATGTTAGMTAATPAGVASSTRDTAVTGTHSVAVGERESIPMLEESLRVGKREARGGRVRVRSYVMETPVEESVTLREERVHVERLAVNRAVTASDLELFKDRVIEAEESIEEAVVAKDVRVTGEVVISKVGTEHVETIRDTVRRTEVDVDQDIERSETVVSNESTIRPIVKGA